MIELQPPPVVVVMDELVCGICHDDAFAELGEIDSCNHRFCYPCISKWASIESKCPFCKLRFTRIVRKLLDSPSKRSALDPSAQLPGQVLGSERVSERNQRVVFENPSFVEWIEGLACIACGGAENEDSLLICDGCDQASHTYCVGLDGIPEGEWFCSHCSAVRAAAQHRRRGRQARAPAAPPAAAAIRERAPAAAPRRRTRPVLDSSSCSEEEAQPPVRRRRHNSPPAARRGGDNLADFVVSDDEDESDDGRAGGDVDGEYVAEGWRQPQGRGQRPLPANRQRRARPRAALLQLISSEGDSEEGFEEIVKSDIEEDSELSEEEAPMQRRQQRRQQAQQHVSLEDRPLAERLSLRERSSSSQSAAATRQRTGSRQQEEHESAAFRRQQQQQQQGRYVAPTADHRRVNAISEHWHALRTGAVSFHDLLGPSAAGPAAPEAQGAVKAESSGGRQRGRLMRAGDAEGEQQSTRSMEEPNEVLIDLTSPSPPSQRQQQKSQKKQQKKQQREPSPPLLSLSARLRRELAQCQERGAQLLPRQRPLPVPPRRPNSHSAHQNSHRQQQQQQRGAVTATPAAAAGGGGQGRGQWQTGPHSAGGGRLRTVADLVFFETVARNTPGSTSAGPTPPAGGPPASGQRNSRLYSSSRGDPPPGSNPFNRYQFGSGGGGGSGDRHLNPDGRSSPRPLRERLMHRSMQSEPPGGGFRSARELLAAHGNGWPPPPPPPQQQQQVHNPRRLSEEQPWPLPSTFPSHSPIHPTPSSLVRPVRRRFVVSSQSEGQEEDFQVPETQLQERPAKSSPSVALGSPSSFEFPPPTQPNGSWQLPTRAGPHADSPMQAVAAAAQGVQPAANGKQVAYDLVKAQLRPRFQVTVYNREAYKEVAQAATRQLYEIVKAEGEGAAAQVAAQVVEQALKGAAL